MSSLGVSYNLDQDAVRRIVRYARNWGRAELNNDRLRKIEDMELFEMGLAATRQWEGPGYYRVKGPCDAADRENIPFEDFESFISYMSNWSRTMRLEKTSDASFNNHKSSGGYDD